MARIVFLTFTDKSMKAGRRRVSQQAREIEVYPEVFGASDKALPPAFRQRFHEYLRPEHRGYGYSHGIRSVQGSH
jgi:hypothetical protein